MHGLDRAEVIEMLGVDVGDDTDLGRQADEGIVALVGFHYHPFALAEARIRAPGIDDTAGDDGRIEARRLKDVGNERGRRRLAVGPRHRDSRAHAHELGQHIRPPDHRDAALAGGFELDIVLLDRARDDDVAGADEVHRVVPDEDAHAALA